MKKKIKDFLYSDILDIKDLLSLALGCSKSYLYANCDYHIKNFELIKLKKLIKRRKNGEPFAYLSGNKGFYHLNFKVTKDVLIPRPESEILIDIALKIFNPKDSIKVLELGTGSGAIAITLADKCNNWNITATDKSSNILKVAKDNAKDINNTINFKLCNWFSGLNDNSFELIISNPPYIKENDSHLNSLKFEPIEALVSGKQGLKDISNIIKNSNKHLKNNGYLLIEHGYNQKDRIVKLMQNYFTNISCFKDINGVDRAILAKFKK